MSLLLQSSRKAQIVVKEMVYSEILMKAGSISHQLCDFREEQETIEGAPR